MKADVERKFLPPNDKEVFSVNLTTDDGRVIVFEMFDRSSANAFSQYLNELDGSFAVNAIRLPD